ncbi:glycoside hydrolase family 125 protein [Actinoplanes subtropicus]|uniref:glycoside hydrolase family 125 protein n=1 Tax=Actinoplanes subtropicus TaxID=543632 RepID=UPI00068ECA26|nr:glycoside hydrolase family 125 protein [Actinoplanes subtropicus]
MTMPAEIRSALPPSLAAVAAPAAGLLQRRYGAGDTFRGCFASAWTTTLRGTPGDPFVITGDIPAMWHRDTLGQLRPYLVAAGDPEVRRVLGGVVRRMARGVLLDPYANAINDGPTGAHADEHDRPPPGPGVWERKYELDSLCAVLSSGYELWAAGGGTDHLDDEFGAAAVRILELWRTEQDHERHSPYRFERLAGEFQGDTLDRGGLGTPVARTGMTWSGFRPSDDRCEYGYLVPANAAAVVALDGLVHLGRNDLLPADVTSSALALAAEIAAGVARHGVVEAGMARHGVVEAGTARHGVVGAGVARDGLVGADVVDAPAGPVYAYEVDGLGGANLMDDANVPSLLSLPYLGWCDRADPTYRRTRAMVLSDVNPYFYRGAAATGVGSPHTPARHVWPMALCMQALTAESAAEADGLFRTLLATDAGAGLMHESLHVDDPAVFTRPWFAWANSLFAELGLRLAGTPVPRPIPPMPDEVAAAVREVRPDLTLHR